MSLETNEKNKVDEQNKTDEKNEKNIKSACKDYNTLKYKTMIATGHNMDKKIENEANEEDVHSFLMNEMTAHKKQPWNKLTKTDKIKKITQYIQTTLKDEYKLTPSECKQTQKYIIALIERKKLTKNSELLYNAESGFIETIHIILFNSNLRKFTLNKDFNSSLKKKPTNQKTKTIKKVKQPTGESKIENDIKP